jgi:hypothetical protein
VGFGKMAVFATIARSRANSLSEQFVHAYDLGSLRRTRDFRAFR